MRKATLIFCNDGTPIVDARDMSSIQVGETKAGEYYIGIHALRSKNYISIFRQWHYQINITVDTFSNKAMEYMDGVGDYDIYPACSDCVEWLENCVINNKFIERCYHMFKTGSDTWNVPTKKFTFNLNGEEIKPPTDYWKDITVKGYINEDLTHKQKRNEKESKDTGSLEQRKGKRGITIKTRSKRSRATIKSGSIPVGKGFTRR